MKGNDKETVKEVILKEGVHRSVHTHVGCTQGAAVWEALAHPAAGMGQRQDDSLMSWSRSQKRPVWCVCCPAWAAGMGTQLRVSGPSSILTPHHSWGLSNH